MENPLHPGNLDQPRTGGPPWDYQGPGNQDPEGDPGRGGEAMCPGERKVNRNVLCQSG